MILIYEEYRKNHGMAPIPMMPSRGMVIATGDDSDEDSYYYYASAGRENERLHHDMATRLKQERMGRVQKSDKQVQREKPPLRILVIGDSLAAGVGTSKSSTPVLPESIALALSKAYGGRPVYWTCTGIPGCTASEIVDEIYQLDDGITNDESQISLLDRLHDWQIEMKIRAQKRYEMSKRKAKQWFDKQQKRTHSDDVPSDQHDYDKYDSHHSTKNTNSNNCIPLDDTKQHQDDTKVSSLDAESSEATKSKWERFLLWINHSRQRLTRDIHDITEVIMPTVANDDEENKDIDSFNLELEIQNEILLHKTRNTTTNNTYKRRRHSIDPDLVGKYDIAIILTGLNDLKDTFLPFMMDAKKRKERELLASKQRQEVCSEQIMACDDDNEESDIQPVDGLRRELLRIIDALQNKMKSVRYSLPQNNNQHQIKPKAAIDDGDQQKQQTGTSKNIIPNIVNKGDNDHLISGHDNPTLIATDTKKIEDRSYWYQDNSPIVVFPALPYEPIELTRWVPLRWFVIPLLNSIDRHKEALAQMYPGLVLYVDSPNNQVIRDAEFKRGPLWDGLDTEKIHFRITDVKQQVQERILDSMKKHYDTWIQKRHRDDDDEDVVVRSASDENIIHQSDEHNDSKLKNESTKEQEIIGKAIEKKARRWGDEVYELDLDGINVINHKERSKAHVGATMIAPDGMHPNDDGYDMWGMFAF
jgi:hypothetical protein